MSIMNLRVEGYKIPDTNPDSVFGESHQEKRNLQRHFQLSRKESTTILDDIIEYHSGGLGSLEFKDGESAVVALARLGAAKQMLGL